MLNIFRLFILKSFYLLRERGVFSEIFPLAFTGDLSIKNLRKYILEKKNIHFIEAFPERDNPKKRVFEAAKMSVCILNAQNNHKTNDFFIRLNHDRFIDLNSERNYIGINEIKLLDENYYTFPLSSEKETKLLLKVYSKSIKVREIGHCNTGEADMTFCKPFFTSDSSDATLLKGAIIDRYILRDKMSQGEIEFLKEDEFLKNKTSIDINFKKTKRIVLQGITGVNEVTRLKMMLIQNAYCANSLNYLTFKVNVNLEYMLGILNSTLLNFVFKIFSTNSNVNGYEVDNLPIPDNISENIKKLIESKVVKIIGGVKTFKYLVFQIDLIIYKLYTLTYDECKIVDPGIEKLISREDYEKKSIEELAEYEIKN